MVRALIAFVVLLAGPAAAGSPARTSPVVVPGRIVRPQPVSARPYVEILRGVAITDPYRWLESVDTAEVRRWAAAQDIYAEQVLRESPGRARVLDALISEIEALPTLETVFPIADGIIFDRWLPTGQTYRIARPGEAERDLFDPGLLARSGRPARVRAVIPSWDGRYAAVTTTGSGDAAPQVSVIEIATGHMLQDKVSDLLTTTSGARYRVAWLPDGSGFVYPRLGDGALAGPAVERLARGRQYLHRIGSPQSADVPLFGFDVDPNMAFAHGDLPTSIVTAPGSGWMVATASRVRANVSELWAARLDDLDRGGPRWRRIAGDGFGHARLRGDTVYAIANGDPDRGRIVSLDLADGATEWRTEIAERAGVLQDFVLARDALYFTEYLAGAVQLRRARDADGAIETLTVPIAGDLRLAPHDPTRDTPWLKAQSWTDPGTWFRIPPAVTDVEAAGIDPGGTPIDPRRFVTRHIMIEADDGVRIPVSLVHPAGLRLDGTAPLLIESYGGYGRVQAPAYNPSLSAWVRQGAVYAYAHVRGGGELGASWRRVATRERKVRSSRDIVAVANALVRLGYTGRGRIAVLGMSAGAQLPGLAVTIDPELFGAAIFDVGRPDEIRGARLDPTAARNIAEMGDMDTTAGIRLLARVSPYHQVPAHARLPGMIVKTGADDYNFGGISTDAKYVARLQAANAGARPIIWMKVGGGHDGILGNDPEVSARAIAFTLWQTGHPAFQPAR